MTLTARLLVAASLLTLPVVSIAQTSASKMDAKAMERAFDAQISSADQLAWLKEMASAPNHVGSPHNRAIAEMQLSLFKEWGWDARIETFQVLYPTPVKTVLELISPEPAALGGQEPVVPGDSSTANLQAALPPYVVYQGDGDVTAPVVYVNYGMPSDYDALAARGISVKGKIVLARYGGGWRGLKPKLAQEHGAIGCLIYSDPVNDGYAVRDPYPRGGGRPEGGVQRGSVADLTLYPGDPLTPGVGSTDGVKRLTREAAPTIVKIPTLPISYGDAITIMSKLEGPVVDGSARGGLALAYHWGGTDAVKVHLAVQSDWSLKTIYNVIAVMPGKTRPDEWVVRGNHRDAWVFGAKDPLSGQVALMSEAKALGALARTGWRPDRTIVYASWDGEEAGLLGSTEWVEAHADELAKKAILYINTDGNSRGRLSVNGSQTLQHFVKSAARDVVDPQTSVSVLDRLKASLRAGAYLEPARGNVDAAALASASSNGDMAIDALGSGSDYTAFLHHLGIPSLDLGFSGEGGGNGAYHSAYDTFDYVTRFDDPGLVYGAVLSKMTGRLVLRAAAGPRLPMRYSDFATTVARYVSEVKALAANQRAKDRTLRDLLRTNVFKLASNPADPTVGPVDKGVTPMIDMLVLEDAADRLVRSASAADMAVGRLETLPQTVQARMLTLLRDIDQLLIDREGLPGRPWYRNLISAPGTLTGYGAKTLPGIREAIEQRRYPDATTYVSRTAVVLNAYADRLDAAAALSK